MSLNKVCPNCESLCYYPRWNYELERFECYYCSDDSMKKKKGIKK